MSVEGVKAMSCTSTQIINQAKSWIGCKESDGSHKKIIDVYNSQKSLARGYKAKYTDSWCAIFVSACAVKCKEDKLEDIKKAFTGLGMDVIEGTH